MAVLGRATQAGVLAGVLSGAAAVLVFVVTSVVAPASGGPDGGELVGATINYLVLACLLGAATGTVLAVPVGLALGALHGALTGRPMRCRIATALLCAIVVLAFGAVGSALGVAPGYLGLLVFPALAVTAVFGAWRGPFLVDGPGWAQRGGPATGRLSVTDPERHRHRRR